MTHYIRHLSFGEDYPGIVNPLDRTNVTAPQGTCLGASPLQLLPTRHPCLVFTPHGLLPAASMMFQYFVKVVPTVYMKVDGEVSRGTSWGEPKTASPEVKCCSDPRRQVKAELQG